MVYFGAFKIILYFTLFFIALHFTPENPERLYNRDTFSCYTFHYYTIMDIETFREYCLSKPETTEGLPFGPDTLVFKVANKMFALTGLDSVEFKVNLKCDPDRALELREQYDDVQPGYHMNKQHWNTVHFEGEVPNKLLYELIDHSYLLIVQSLKKVDRERILALL